MKRNRTSTTRVVGLCVALAVAGLSAEAGDVLYGTPEGRSDAAGSSGFTSTTLPHAMLRVKPGSPSAGL